MIRWSVSLATLGGLFLIALLSVSLGLAYLEIDNLALGIGFSAAFSLIIFFISPWINDKLLQWINGMKWIPLDDLAANDPHCYALLSKLCQADGIEMPRIGYIDDLNPTAFTYGCFRNDARIVISKGFYHFTTPEQRAAVLAHEFAHIRNYDMAIMTGAAFLVSVCYQITNYLHEEHKRKNQKIFRSDKEEKQQDKLAVIIIVAYLFYLLGTYLLLFLSRVREYQADRFAAYHTSAADLAGALVAIAYGIAEVDDTDKTHRLMHLSRCLGAVDIKNCGNLGNLAVFGQKDPQLVAKVMQFDLYNPWASWLELSSTHPLTGKRIGHLAKLADEFNQPFPDYFEQANLSVDRARMWRIFSEDFIIGLLPLGFGMMAGWYYESWLIGLLGLLVGSMLYQLFWRYPLPHKTETQNLIDLLTDPYASPMRGRYGILVGNAIGRADPGNRFSPSLFLRSHGVNLSILYYSVWGFLGNLYQAIMNSPKFLNQRSVQSEGWYFRTISSFQVISRLSAGEIVMKSHLRAGIIVYNGFLILALILFWYLLRDAGPEFHAPWQFFSITDLQTLLQ